LKGQTELLVVRRDWRFSASEPICNPFDVGVLRAIGTGGTRMPSDQAITRERMTGNRTRVLSLGISQSDFASCLVAARFAWSALILGSLRVARCCASHVAVSRLSRHVLGTDRAPVSIRTRASRRTSGPSRIESSKIGSPSESADRSALGLVRVGTMVTRSRIRRALWDAPLCE
jgi:hypothetical protein